MSASNSVRVLAFCVAIVAALSGGVTAAEFDEPGDHEESMGPDVDAEANALGDETDDTLPVQTSRDESTPYGSYATEEINRSGREVLDSNSKTLRGELAESVGHSLTEAPLASIKAPLKLLGAEVAAGDTARLAWEPGTSFAGIAVPTPVLMVNGAGAGPVLCLTAAVHGDELNGIEMVRRVLYDIDASKLNGAVIGVPIVNLLGFKRSSRYLPDRRDLNRYFPGNRRGSSASRIAYSFFQEVIVHCDLLIDLHTGSDYRTNLPQLRADLDQPEVRTLTENFGDMIVVYSRGGRGTLRRASVDAGIPAVTLEAGEPLRFQVEEVEKGVKRIFAVMDQFGMYRKLRVWGNPSPIFYRSRWVRVETGGILLGRAKLGQAVAVGEVLGRVVDPITNFSSDVVSRFDGRVIGMAVDQVVMPGFAAFHIGIRPPEHFDEPWAPAEDSNETGDPTEQSAVAEELDDA